MSGAKVLVICLLLCTLAGCSSGPGWHWEHPQGLDAARQQRDLSECLYYASITDPRAFAAERPVQVQEWDEGVQECMGKRGWIFVEPNRKK